MLLHDGTNTRISYLNLGDTIAKAVRIFMDLKIAIIPVLDEEGGLLSIFSRSSLYRAILDGATNKDIIDPFLIKEVISISDDIPDDKLADFVKASSVGSVPVVNGEGKVIGLLCKANMVVTLFRRSELLNVQLKAILDSMHNGVIGKHVKESMEANRLYIVASTGVSETSDVLTIQGKPLIVSRMPIIRKGEVVGAVGKAVFPQLAEARELAEKLCLLENKVTFFQEELQKNKTAQDIMKGMVAESTEMKKLKEEITIVASSSSTVLITGESGTGKEGVAHAVHLCSDRCKGPFIKVNCAAIPENLIEAEMFGYVRGAFTGAAKAGKPGRLEMADGGTLFLDEIGDMPFALQSKLLRVIQEREFERLGGTKSIKVNVRILAATNKNLNNAISQGEFREDLFYRLNVINLHLPPLRERAVDIEPLTHFFISKFNHILNSNVIGIADNAMRTLLNYAWPGNIRELENVVERAVNYTRSGLIQLTHLPNHIIGNSTSQSEVSGGTIRHQDHIALIERNMIVEALEKAGGNKSKAAKLLNLSRSRLYDKLNKYDLKY